MKTIQYHTPFCTRVQIKSENYNTYYEQNLLNTHTHTRKHWRHFVLLRFFTLTNHTTYMHTHTHQRASVQIFSPSLDLPYAYASPCFSSICLLKSTTTATFNWLFWLFCSIVVWRETVKKTKNKTMLEYMLHKALDRGGLMVRSQRKGVAKTMSEKGNGLSIIQFRLSMFDGYYCFGCCAILIHVTSIYYCWLNSWVLFTLLSTSLLSLLFMCVCVCPILSVPLAVSLSLSLYYCIYCRY